MKIAYISYEYPTETAFGGVATYVHQVANMMNERGHQVEVFCASLTASSTENIDGVIVHRILTDSRFLFPYDVLPVFTKFHEQSPFDIIESPEFSADGIEIKRKYPKLPLIVKLHTPWYLIFQLNTHYLKSYQKIKRLIGGFVKGKLVKDFVKYLWRYNRKIKSDPDYQIAILADQIHTPSVSLGDIVSKKWGIDRSAILNVPYPFIPNNKLLEVPAETSLKTVTFVGRLELRKGIVELVKALPTVFEQAPNFKMRFVGRVQPSHKRGVDMDKYILTQLDKYKDRIEIVSYPSDEVHKAYSDTDICVFPSLWENFPNVCLEAMSAARGIVASKFGGMSDMLINDYSGILVDPFNHGEVADAIIRLLTNENIRIKFGENARKNLLAKYNKKVVGEMMETHYNAAIVNLGREKV